MPVPKHADSRAIPAREHFTDAMNSKIAKSVLEGGVYLDNMMPGITLELSTQNHTYRILYVGQGRAFISGHPTLCPTPVLVKILGSTWGGSMIRNGYLGRGMHLEYQQASNVPITTSKILDIRL